MQGTTGSTHTWVTSGPIHNNHGKMAREHDIVVFGATGFTGVFCLPVLVAGKLCKLVTSHLPVPLPTTTLIPALLDAGARVLKYLVGSKPSRCQATCLQDGDTRCRECDVLGRSPGLARLSRHSGAVDLL